MKLVTFSFKEEAEENLGVYQEDRILYLDEAIEYCVECCSHPVPDLYTTNSMLSFLESGEIGLAEVTEAVRCAETHQEAFYSLDEVNLLSPIPHPRKVFCLAGNYIEHLKEGVKKHITGELPQTPRIFMKPPSTTVIGPGQPITISRLAQIIDWEAELAVVIGKRGKYIAECDALNYVAGYTIFNDISERKLRIRHRDKTEEWDRFFDWLNGKWMDGFAPMGPYLVTKDEVSDPQAFDICLRVNGELKQSANTREMIFSIGNIIEYLSSFVTLEPGDVIATGTPSGVGFARGEKLQPGDVVEVEIEQLGLLRNPVVAEE